MRGPRTVMKSGPHSPQLEEALAQKRRPNTPKIKLINKLINLKNEYYDIFSISGTIGMKNYINPQMYASLYVLNCLVK